MHCQVVRRSRGESGWKNKHSSRFKCSQINTFLLSWLQARLITRLHGALYLDAQRSLFSRGLGLAFVLVRLGLAWSDLIKNIGTCKVLCD